MKRTTILAILTMIALGIALGGFSFFRGERVATNEDAGWAAALESITPADFRFAEKSADEETAEFDATGGAVSESLDGWRLYRNGTYGYSFQYPEDLRLASFGDERGDVLLVEGQNGRGFQVFVSVFDELSEHLTPERVRAELPDMRVDDSQTALLEGGQTALIFFSEAQGLGRTREAWIVHERYLYQITAQAAFDGELARIMGTWRFE